VLPTHHVARGEWTLWRTLPDKAVLRVG
jgi:hypothetical protein